MASGLDTDEHVNKAELVELAIAMAEEQRGDQSRLIQAAAALRSVDEQLLLDAAAVAAFFSTMTRVVDATGQRNAAFDKAAAVVTAVLDIKRGLRRRMPQVASLAAIAIVAVAGYVAKRRRLI